MQPYRYDIKKFIAISAVIAIITNWLTSWIFSAFGASTFLNLGLSTSIVGLFWFLFDQYFWKMDVFRRLGISELPDINGVWVGDVNRLGENNPHRFELRVFQTYTKISIQTNSENSKGNSVCATFLTDETRRNFDLVNYWSSRTKTRDPDKNFHEEFRGVSLIDIRNHDDQISLEDYYFTDRNPSTKGKVRLHRVSKKLPVKNNMDFGETFLSKILGFIVKNVRYTLNKHDEKFRVSRSMNKKRATYLDLETSIISNKSGKPYLGCKLEKANIKQYLEQVSDILGSDFQYFENNRRDRDGVDYHVTILSPEEYRQLVEREKNNLIPFVGKLIRFEILGVGRAVHNDDEAFFVVLESSEADALRKQLAIGDRDFHITIGFSEADVHGVSKGKDALI
ncbi:Cap15 family cyclic dinucleotide receptor domain-containing protein [Hyphobacterium indicum]|uniref:Cap15 family cyclic dinucleotide receptor domain-containing protein n=1 Tax=Hyphobacterium indicum TaxID=2162714 RepID=UPI000F639A28|nr:hypothetical protein [Hyphobacterium indicum]